MDIKHLNSKIEELSEEVHNAWMKEKPARGFHAPVNCHQKGLLQLHDESMFHKFEKLCPKCPVQEIEDDSHVEIVIKTENHDFELNF